MSFKGKVVNRVFGWMDRCRDNGLVTPDTIQRTDDIQYGNDLEWQTLDVYRLKNYDKRLPVIINVHGGGWVYGRKSAYQFYCMDLAKRGFAVVNFSYRLAPIFQFPAQLEDLNAVVHWVMENGHKYAFNTKQIFLVGDSAGAHLASLYAGICTGGILSDSDDMYAYKTMSTPNGFSIRGIGLTCGIYNTLKLNHNGLFGFRSLLKDLLGKADYMEKLKKINILQYVNEHYPPTFLVTANGDFLRNQSIEMKSILDTNHVNFEFREYGGKFNILLHVFHLDVRSKHAQNCMDLMCAFFKKNR